MNVKIILNGQDVTDSCLLTATRIQSDSTKRITSASITIMGQALGAAAGRYDYARYDEDRYSIALRELYEVQIIDARDGVTKLFDGNIYALTMQQSDVAQFQLFYQCDLNDFAAWLDRSVCWNAGFPLTLPNSDKGIITALMTEFCPRITLGDIAEITPVVQKYDWVTKTCRQVLDDMSTLSMASWHVDFDGVLHYYLASAAPPAPFGLSTSPDYVNTFPVKVDGYKHDFTNPINRMFVRGTQDPQTGITIEATYADPVSIQTYGEYASGLVDSAVVTGWDAALRAKSTVLQFAYPIETGNFTIWGPDGLQVGMQVHIHDDWIGMDGYYTIRQLSMQWVDKELVMYQAQFGATQPDLETIIRLLDQRTKWATSNVPVSIVSPGPPPPGSVSDSSIAPGGLSANVINSINATTIQGLINAGQIGGVNANTIIGGIAANQITAVNAGSVVGLLSASQIGSVTASVVQGVFQANQIGSVNATTIQGVILSSQLADQIINTLSKYADALRPIQMIHSSAQLPTLPNPNFPPNSFYYYVPNGHFYRITPDGLGTIQDDNPQNALMQFYYIGAISAQSIVGVISAANIGSITAGQITGLIQSNQIGSVDASVIVGNLNLSGLGIVVNASMIQGQIQASQIATINASQITGTIQANQIATIQANQIQGTLAYNQIGSINAATITIGQLTANQIASVSGQALIIGSVTSDRFNGYSIDIGGLANLPGRIRVFNGASAIVAQMGYLGEVGAGAYGGWFQLFGAGGTSYANAPIFTDSNGNLTIRAVNMSGSSISGANITNSTLTNSSLSQPTININGQITTGPQVFDGTYGSLAMQNSDGTDMTSFISRGLVFYNGGQKIGSLVRSPYGNYLALECTVGGAYVLIDGANGVRSDSGYVVAGQRVINNAGQFVGTVVGAVSSNSTIYTASSCQANGGFYGGGFFGSLVQTGGTCYAGSGFTGGPFQGAGVNCPNNGISGAGFNPTGFVGQSWSIAFHDNTGQALQLWINGVNYGQIQLRFVGGVLIGTA